MLLARYTRRLDSFVRTPSHNGSRTPSHNGSRTPSHNGSRILPQLKRRDYKILADSDASIFESIVGSKWSVKEVSPVIVFYSGKNIAVVPQRSNTGLVGDSNSIFDEVIMKRMSEITNNDAGAVECHTGAILGNIKNIVPQHGYAVPLALGSRGSCTVGGQPRRTLSTNPGLTHVDSEGTAKMVDVHNKEATTRRAVAMCYVHLGLSAFRSVIDNTNKKGDVLSVARVAGIMAAKQTSSLIPLCHTLNLEHVTIEFDLVEEDNVLYIRSSVQCNGRTGVEMEALCSVSVAALTVHDMCKAINPGIVISGIQLLEKSGGVRGDYVRKKE